MKTGISGLAAALVPPAVPAMSQVHNDNVWRHGNLNRKNCRQYLHIQDIDCHFTMRCNFHVHGKFMGSSWQYS
ncbi:MAG: hypothetical protein NC115_09790 [Bacteroidales bacterium]|nr:hypothetical protein [Bacteroidales bacterium]